eukprot:12631359-Alexandrium_andersonii.AAC.1
MEPARDERSAAGMDMLVLPDAPPQSGMQGVSRLRVGREAGGAEGEQRLQAKAMGPDAEQGPARSCGADRSDQEGGGQRQGAAGAES